MTDRLGTCPVCMGLCAALLTLSLAACWLGAGLSSAAVQAIGAGGALIFGILTILHGIFYLAGPMHEAEPMAPHALRPHRPDPPPTARRGCCGRWT